MSAVWGFFAPRYTPGSIGPSLVSAAISTVTVVTCCIIFTPQFGLISLMGALIPFWETGRPLWARIRNSLLVSAVLTASMATGVLLAPYSWAIVPGSVLIILVVGVLYYAFMLTRGPSPVMLFYAAVLGTFFGSDQHVGWKMVGVTAFAAGLTSVLLLLPLIFDPHGPERKAVAVAHRAVRYHQDQTLESDKKQRLARNAAFEAVNSAWLTLQSTWPATPGRRIQALTAELQQISRNLANTVLPGLGEHSPMGPSTSAPPPGRGRPGWRFLLSHALRGDSVEWFSAWRMGVAAGIAGYVSQAVGIGHPYWAILAATVVLNQWIDRRAATRRAAHRTVGTLLGVGVVWAVSALHLSPVWTVVVVIVCVIGQYVVFPMNYALALIFITPMALLAVEASGTGGTVASLTFDRLIDTIIGAVTAVAVTWGTSWYFPRRLVRSQSARSTAAIDAMEKIHGSGGQSAHSVLRAHAELQYELIHQQSILDRAVADDPRLADLVPDEHGVADRGYVALARTWKTAIKRTSESR